MGVEPSILSRWYNGHWTIKLVLLYFLVLSFKFKDTQRIFLCGVFFFDVARRHTKREIKPSRVELFNDYSRLVVVSNMFYFHPYLTL